MNVSKIFFKGNPYPKGHLIKKFEWSARLDWNEDENEEGEIVKEIGIYFDFHLETDKYYVGNEEVDNEDIDYENEEIEDWNAPIVWKNYHACTISSKYWHYGGILVGTPDKKLDFNNLERELLKGDLLPRKDDFDHDEDMAFGIYLLGHDDCADHNIQIKKNENNRFDINWKGKIALAYAGDYEFKYEFEANIYDVEFGGVYHLDGLTKAETDEILEQCAVNYEQYELKVLRP